MKASKIVVLGRIQNSFLNKTLGPLQVIPSDSRVTLVIHSFILKQYQRHKTWKKIIGKSNFIKMKSICLFSKNTTKKIKESQKQEKKIFMTHVRGKTGNQDIERTLTI